MLMVFSACRMKPERTQNNLGTIRLRGETKESVPGYLDLKEEFLVAGQTD